MGLGSYSATCSTSSGNTYTVNCNGCSSTDVVSNASQYTYWDGAAAVSLCEMINTAISNCVSKGVTGASKVTSGMVMAILSNEACTANPNILQCPTDSCTSGCSPAPDGCGIGLVQITPPSIGHITNLIDYGLAPSGTSYCEMIASCNENGPLWSIESLVIHLGKELEAGESLSYAFCTWNGGDGATCSGCDGGVYADCAMGAYNNNSDPCSSSSGAGSGSAIAASDLYFYAATSDDFNVAVAVAVSLGVPGSNVTGYYNQAWTWAESTDHLLIAVGAFATDQMYYNPCAWNNQPAGSTPFNLVGPGPDSQNSGTPVDQLPPNNYSATTVPWFVNAGGDGYLWETFVLAYLLGYYALHGAWPNFYDTSISIPAITPSDTCPSGASTPVTCTDGDATN